jgi:uncharacterized membrane protein YcaP (DUF421 family)
VLYNGFEEVWRAVLTGATAYAALVVVVRLMGKRTLSKLNAFDFVVTVALGSALASALMTSGVSAARAVTAFVTLTAMQFAVTWLSPRASIIRRIVRAEPVMLVDRGSFLDEAMTRQRVTEAEVRQAVRGAGTGSLSDINAVVLETDGSLSVITGDAGDRSALRDVATETTTS